MLVETTFSETKVSVHMLFQDCSSLKRSRGNMSHTSALYQSKSTKKLWILSLKNRKKYSNQLEDYWGIHPNGGDCKVVPRKIPKPFRFTRIIETLAQIIYPDRISSNPSSMFTKTYKKIFPHFSILDFS